MARIRTIKPDFWTSEQIMDCKPLTRLLFIGLWNFVDDYGRSPVAPRTIRARIFPSDDITGADVQDMLNELNARGLILFYSAQGQEYFEITGWAKHQKIDNPSKNNLCPAPFSEGSEILASPSEEKPTIALEGKGRDRKVKEKDTPSASPPGDENFAEFKRDYPKRAGNYGWKAAWRKYSALVKTGVDPKAIHSAVLRHAEEMRKLKRVGTEFVPMPASWLNQEDFSESAVAALEEKPIEIDWPGVLSFYKKTGRWSPQAGPDPDSMACKAPPDLLREFGLLKSA